MSGSATEKEASYVYMSPGSSIRDPVLTGHSLSNADVYHYDPRPSGSVQAQPVHTASKATTPSGPRAQQQQYAARPTAAFAQQQVQQQQQQRAEAAAAAPTYVYTPPGSSISSPSYGFSVRDPVYVVDPAPPAKHKKQQQAPPPPPRQQKVAATPAPGRKRVGLPVDDLAHQPYVASPRGSMHEPKYVSISDPQDVAAHGPRK